TGLDVDLGEFGDGGPLAFGAVGGAAAEGGGGGAGEGEDGEGVGGGPLVGGGLFVSPEGPHEAELLDGGGGEFDGGVAGGVGLEDGGEAGVAGQRGVALPLARGEHDLG